MVLQFILLPFPNTLNEIQGPPPFKIYHSAKGTMLLIAIGVLAGFSQGAIATALSLEKAGRLSIINFTQILVTYGFDVFYMGRKATWPDIVGSLLIVGFTLVTNIITILKTETETQKQPKEEKKLLTLGT